MHGVQPNANAKPHHIGAPQPDRLRHLQPLLPVQQRDRRQAEEMQPHDDDDDAGDDGERAGIGADQRADHAGAGAERDEHGGEAADEQHGGQHRLALHPRLRLARRRAAPARCRPDRPDKAAPAAARRATGS